MRSSATWWIRLKAWLVFVACRVLLATVRVRTLHKERLQEAREGGRPILYAFWHGRQLALFGANPERRLCVLASLSRDGEMQSRICRRFGLEVVRGSSSRGGLGGLLALGRRLREGLAVGLAVDGPRGPAFEAKPGIVALARRTGSPIVPITAAFGRFWSPSRAWDRFAVPAPFTRALVAYGSPLGVPPRAGPEEMRQIAARLTESLRVLTAEVDAACSRR